VKVLYVKKRIKVTRMEDIESDEEGKVEDISAENRIDLR